MDRSDWLKEKRRAAEVRMDTLFAPVYDENWGVIDPIHQQCFQRFLSLCPPQATVLDAACGTGKYWPLILASGRSVVGIDQSQEMLNRAHAKYPEVRVEKVGLQEMDYRGAFDAACCMDAMEFVFPEDWLLVLNNLTRAVRQAGHLYFTVEIAGEKEIEKAFVAGQQAGLPVVYGEWAHEGGYHYYPKIERVREWIRSADLHLVAEAVGEEYHHFLVQRTA